MATVAITADSVDQINVSLETSINLAGKFDSVMGKVLERAKLIQKSVEKIQTIDSNINTAMQEQASIFSTISTKVSEIASKSEALQDSFKEVATSNNELVKTQSSMKQLLTDVKDELTSMSKSFKNVETSANEIEQRIADSSSATQEFQDKILKAYENSTKLPSAFEDAENNIVDAAGAVKSISKEVDSASNKAGDLGKKILGGITSYMKSIDFSKIAEMTDAYSASGQKVKSMVDETTSAEMMQQKIYGAAERSRTSYSGMVDSMSALSSSAGGVFDTSQELVTFSEQMNKHYKMGGASADEQAAAMKNLATAMGSDQINGDVFKNLMDSAPSAIDALMTYTGKSKEELKALADEGGITADVMKNAMFAGWQDTNAAFQEMPMTFSDLGTRSKDAMLEAFGPVMEKITTLISSDEFLTIFDGIVEKVDLASGAVSVFLDAIGAIVQYFADNWGSIEPILMGVAGGLGALAVASGIAAIKQMELNLAWLASPVFWIGMAIGIVIGLLYKVVEANGGLQMSLMKLKNVATFAFDFIKFKAQEMNNKIANVADLIQIAFERAKVGVLNTLGDLKVGALTIIQNLINGAIDAINQLIGLANQTLGMSIELIDHVTFASEQEIENEKKKNSRNKELQDLINHKENERAKRDREAVENLAAASKRYEDQKKKIEEQIAARTKDVQPEVDPYESLVSSAEKGSRPAQSAENSTLNANRGNTYSSTGDTTTNITIEINFPDTIELPEWPELPDFPELPKLPKIELPKPNESDDDPGKDFEIKFEIDNNIKYLSNHESYAYSSNMTNNDWNASDSIGSMDGSDEDLKFIRGVAEQDAINRFTTSEIKIEMNNQNNVNSDMDLDGMVSHLSNKLYETMTIAAEGVYE